MEPSERRVLHLDTVRADGWMERLASGSPNFKQLCDIVGEHFVAFAVLSGVQITALLVDRRVPDATLVDFVIGESEAEQRLPLAEFRRRLVAALLSDNAAPEAELPENPNPEAIQAYLGFRYVLLAPVFGMGLKELHVGGQQPSSVLAETEGADHTFSLLEFRQLIEDRIRGELDRVRPASRFAIDLEVVPQAERANAASDWEKTIQLLGAWPGPLSMLMRTAEGQHLGPEVKSTLAHALALLGTAYARTQRFEWAEEVMRLGIQWSQDGAAAGEIFCRLGEAYVTQDRHGEAIGLLQRALGLGAQKTEVLPLLARCYASRKRFVAAMVCAESAVAAGAESSSVAAVQAEATAVLGDAWTRFRERAPAPSRAVNTVPA